MRTGCVLAALALIVPTVCLAMDSDGHVKVSIPHKFGEALVAGSLQQLKQLDGTMSPVVAAYAYAHIRNQLPELLRDTRRCERAALKKQVFGTTILCNSVARRTAIRLGDAHAYLEEASFYKGHVLTALTKKYGRAFPIGNGLDKLDISKIVTGVPAVRLSWLAPMATVPMRNPEEVIRLAGPPEVQIIIDGRPLTAKIRPSSGLPAPVTIIVPPDRLKDAYARLGLTKLVDPLYHQKVNGQAQSPANDPQLALAESVRFGPLVLRHLGVMVQPSNRLPTGIYVGMSLLGRFDCVAISSHKVVLSKKPLAACKGLVPMTYAGLLTQGGWLRFDAMLGNTTVNTTWNPAYRTAILVDSATFAKVTGQTTAGFIAYGNPKPVSVSIRIGRATLRPEPKLIGTPQDFLQRNRRQMIIGEASLRHYVVHLRFGGKQPLIGFCRRGETSAEQRPESRPAEKR